MDYFYAYSYKKYIKKQGGVIMEISTKIIKSQAIVDMNNWILSFEASDTAKSYDMPKKEVYLNEINKLKTKLLREI